MATHSSFLAWRIPWTEEPSKLQSMGSQRVWVHKEPDTTERLTLLSSQLTKHRKQLHPSTTKYAIYLEQFTTEKSVTRVWLKV